MLGNGLTVEMIAAAKDKLEAAGLVIDAEIGGNVLGTQFPSGDFRREIHQSSDGRWIVSHGNGELTAPMSWSEALDFTAKAYDD